MLVYLHVFFYLMELSVGLYINYFKLLFSIFRIDRDGLADKSGVHVGDQIIDVNGVPFDNITHAHAVEVMKGKRHLILTLRVGNHLSVYC